MELKCTRYDDVLAISITGELDAENVEHLLDLFEKEENSGTTRFVLELGGLEYIDSSGLGAFVKHLKSTRNSGGDLKLSALSPEVAKVLELTRLDQVFDIQENCEAACERFHAVS